MEFEINNSNVEQLIPELRRRFGEIQSRSPHPKGRRYSGEIKQMVRTAHREGVPESEISNICGVTLTAVKRWIGQTNPRPAFRKLKVVERQSSPMVVVLPSGVRIEVDKIGGEFLRELSNLGGAS